MFTTVYRDVTWTNHWGTWKGRWQWFLKCMECSGVLTIVERFYLHEMPQCSMIHFFKWVLTAFKVPYALSSEIQQRKEKEADFHHWWFSVIPARICMYRLLQGSYQPGEPGEPGVFQGEKVISPGYQGEGLFWGNFKEKDDVIREIFFHQCLCFVSLWNIKRLITKWILCVPGTTVTLWESQLQCVYVFVF